MLRSTPSSTRLWKATTHSVARRDLPSGTVTFLFTDVEGSTKLLHELGAEGYAEALAEHRRVIRDACARNGGVEVDTQGDAFFFAFPTAPGALGAAEEMTRELASGLIQVRIGLHTGTPLLTDEGYVGADVHRAARIAASGHGGRMLVSQATASLLPSDALRDLGEHRFKDLAAPERVYQLEDGDFPPLKSLYRTNLPVPATGFLGRERELDEVLELLLREGTRAHPDRPRRHRQDPPRPAGRGRGLRPWWLRSPAARAPAVSPSVLLLAAALRSLGTELGVPVAVTRLAALEAVETAYRDELDRKRPPVRRLPAEAMTVESLREYLSSLE